MESRDAPIRAATVRERLPTVLTGCPTPPLPYGRGSDRSTSIRRSDSDTPPPRFLPLHWECSPMPVEEPALNATEELPVLTVRDTVIYPGGLLPVTVGRPPSLALGPSLGESRSIAVISQLDPRVETPGPDDLYALGTLCV